MWTALIVACISLATTLLISRPVPVCNSPLEVTLNSSVVANIVNATESALRLDGTGFVDVVCQVSHSILRLGSNFMGDLYSGINIARETFITQFVLDVAISAGIDVRRIEVLEISPGMVAVGADDTSSMVTFRITDVYPKIQSNVGPLEPHTVDVLMSLTAQAQMAESQLRSLGLATSALDPEFGIVAIALDSTLRVHVDIQVIGGPILGTTYSINLGAQEMCLNGIQEGDVSALYCQWEWWFREDLSTALGIELDRVRVVYVKAAGKGFSLVYFRFLPPGGEFNETSANNSQLSTSEAIQQLEYQIHNVSSSLYSGNVTVFVDSSWGVSGQGKGARKSNPYLAIKSYEPSSYSHRDSMIERCKDVQLCNRAESVFLSANLNSTYTTQAFRDGERLPIDLFATFEDWREGVLGWKRKRNNKYDPTLTSIDQGLLDGGVRGGHFFSSYNDTIKNPEVYLSPISPIRNAGLVLDTQDKDRMIAVLKREANEVLNEATWVLENRDTTILLDVDGLTRKSRIDLSLEMNKSYDNLITKHSTYVDIIDNLENSQCNAWNGCNNSNDGVYEPYEWWRDHNGSLAYEMKYESDCKCNLLFNTSSKIDKILRVSSSKSLELTGAINAMGGLQYTNGSNSVPVAVWEFEQIRIGPEVIIEVVGQRAMALISHTSILLNSSIIIEPGMLGGFPGGGSIGKLETDALSDEMEYFPVSSVQDTNPLPVKSCSHNGPGSLTRRYHHFVVKTSALDINEVQRVCIGIEPGQTMGGCFILAAYGRQTTCILPSATASSIQKVIEMELNSQKPTESHVGSSFSYDRSPGSGFIPGVGRASVSLAASATKENNAINCWDIEFISALGDVEQLRVINSLSGIGTWANVVTLKDGNSLGGSFNLRFLGYSRNRTTMPIYHNASSDDVFVALKSLPGVEEVTVQRSVPIADCSDGLCTVNPSPGGGYSWAIAITTTDESLLISPSAPSLFRNQSEAESRVESISPPIAVSSLTGIGAVVEVSAGFTTFPEAAFLASYNSTVPFTIALGGGGGGYGGTGGNGEKLGLVGPSYGDEEVTDLLGGSGGSRGGDSPLDIFAIESTLNSSGDTDIKGGAGGGAIELIANADIILGVMGEISVNGQDGESGLRIAGGGGSGGSVVLAAGGHIQVSGRIFANGGKGGDTNHPEKLNSGGGGGGGRVLIVGQTISKDAADLAEVKGGSCSGPNTPECMGGEGSLVLDSSHPGMSFERISDGILGTNHSFLIHRWDIANSSLARPYDGPEFSLNTTVAPERISTYLKIPSKTILEIQQQRRATNIGSGALLACFSEMEQLNLNSTSQHRTASFGVNLLDTGGLYHGVNFSTVPDWPVYLPPILRDKWYHIDFILTWNSNRTGGVYMLRIDGVLVADEIYFVSKYNGISSIGIFLVGGATAVQLDELYAGPDFTMRFRCPETKRNETAHDKNSFMSHYWEGYDIPTEKHPMKHHENFLSRQFEESGASTPGGFLPPFDGDGLDKVTIDTHVQREFGNTLPLLRPEGISAGSLLFVPGNWTDLLTGEIRENQTMWYGSHLNNISHSYLSGGVGMCSTEDYINWKFEGIGKSIMSEEHFFDQSMSPKVLMGGDNNYVMWGEVVDIQGEQQGMAGVATSQHPDGPFRFKRSFYPDGNETHDQMVFKDANGSAYLARTYFKDVEYTLPSPVMQPIWESVKTSEGTIDNGLNFHRAFYHIDYDNYHDIYLQRWRMEHIPAKIICVNHQTGQNRTVDNEYMTNTGERGVCNEPEEYKIVLGQGNPVATSRFKDPKDPVNSYWKPSSVPSVKAQPWMANYQNGICGLRNMDEDVDMNDPILVNFNATDRSNCSSIADNKLHGTYPDALIGPTQTVLTRRSKYVAVSRLTDDFMESSTLVRSFEGGLELMQDLLSLSTCDDNPFLWSSGSDSSTTYSSPVETEFVKEEDWERQNHQYEQNVNDRSFYSLACISGPKKDCPVA